MKQKQNKTEYNNFKQNNNDDDNDNNNDENNNLYLKFLNECTKESKTHLKSLDLY